MQYGKRIITESYYKGQLSGGKPKVEYQIPELVGDKSQALSEIIKGLELIANRQTTKVVLTVEADPKTYTFKHVITQYLAEE